jgi:hypothetical protein
MARTDADPRLKVAFVVTALQVLGQIGLSFKVSITQIGVPIVICGAADVAMAYRKRREFVWPASGILAGNSVAFILRAAGTRHGDWWTANGIVLFIGAAVVAALSKYVVRVDGRHVFNPSNVGIVVVLLATGVSHAFPQYLWWGPPGWALVAAWIVIVAGACWVVPQIGMLSMVVSFLATFWASIGLLALTGRGFFARWADARLTGMHYWTALCLSPEVAVFVCFMMSDPQTAPRTRRALYGASVALVAAGLCALQTTEFGVKVSILAALTIVCAAMGVRRAKRTKVVFVAVCVALASLVVRTARDRHVVSVEHPAGGSSGVASQ